MISAVAPACSSRCAESVRIPAARSQSCLVVQRVELREVEALDQQRRARAAVGALLHDAVDVLVVGAGRDPAHPADQAQLAQRSFPRSRPCRAGPNGEFRRYRAWFPAAPGGLVRQRLVDFLDHLLGVGQQHHRLVHVEHVVVDPGIADAAHRALDEHHRLGLVDVEHRHAVDRAGLVGLGRRVDHVVGADDERDVGLGELGVDVLELEHLVVGHVGFGQQHVHVPGHAPRDRVDRVLDADAFLLEQVAHLAQRVLRLGDGHAVAGDDDHASRPAGA